jgi:hypothetical protein
MVSNFISFVVWFTQNLTRIFLMPGFRGLEWWEEGEERF